MAGVLIDIFINTGQLRPVFLMGKNMRERIITYKKLKRRGVVSAEEYFWPVPTESTALVDKPAFRAELTEQYPNLYAGAYCLADGNILIPDLPETQSDEVVRLTRDLNDFSTRTLHVIDPMEATQNLINLLNNGFRIDKNSAAVFVGGAGEDLIEYIKLVDSNFLSRFGALAVADITKGITLKGMKPMEVNIQEKNGSLDEMGNFMVLDDVRATGFTSHKVAGELRKFYDKELSYAGWIIIKPDNTYPSGSIFYKEMYTSYLVVGNQMQRPPINSLSKLINNRSIRESYIDKYVRDKEGFQEKLKQIGGEIA